MKIESSKDESVSCGYKIEVKCSKSFERVIVFFCIFFLTVFLRNIRRLGFTLKTSNKGSFRSK